MYLISEGGAGHRPQGVFLQSLLCQFVSSFLSAHDCSNLYDKTNREAVRPVREKQATLKILNFTQLTCKVYVSFLSRRSKVTKSERGSFLFLRRVIFPCSSSPEEKQVRKHILTQLVSQSRENEAASSLFQVFCKVWKTLHMHSQIPHMNWDITYTELKKKKKRRKLQEVPCRQIAAVRNAFSVNFIDENNDVK